MRARTPRPSTSAAATPARGRAGTRSTPARRSGGWGARISPSPSASSSRSSTRTTCSATPPRMSAAATPAPSSATSGSGCRRPSRRICARKPSVHSLMRMGMTAYMGPLRDREAQLDYVNFYAYLHRLVDAKIGRLTAALGQRRGSGVAALPHRRGPLRRPRRDGPLPRRPAAEDVQRLRGDDQRAARLLEPRPVRGEGRDRRARLARGRAADRAHARRPGAAGRTARPRPDAHPGDRARTAPAQRTAPAPT